MNGAGLIMCAAGVGVIFAASEHYHDNVLALANGFIILGIVLRSLGQRYERDD